MRNTQQRVQAALHSAKNIKTRQKIRHAQMMLGGACFCLVLFVSTIVPQLTQQMQFAIDPTNFAGSIFADTAFLQYIIIGCLSFAIGIVFAVFCVLLHRKGDKNDD